MLLQTTYSNFSKLITKYYMEKSSFFCYYWLIIKRKNTNVNAKCIFSLNSLGNFVIIWVVAFCFAKVSKIWICCRIDTRKAIKYLPQFFFPVQRGSPANFKMAAFSPIFWLGESWGMVNTFLSRPINKKKILFMS